ncbi:MAG: OprO/OprP family phosphate-selective porin [Gemmatimonadetes bacterium]|nr:OprO/OprP family phosphate-selective porin [Gemmatimonadota bacterium]
MRTRIPLRIALAALSLSAAAALGAQPAPAFPNPAITLDGKGITINGTDSVTRLNLRFRVQEVFAATSESDDDLSIKRSQFAVRRMRLRLEGVLKDPRLRVNVQLSFARGDMDQENTNFANVLRDAYVTWQFTPHLAGSFGQAKLPGNRQRLVSSSELQSADRSPVNALFTVDRDVGAFLAYSRDVGRARYVIRGAVSSGEGRNPQTGDDGLAWTTRWELLPFGAFTNGGDYFEGDLAREPRLKLSVAAGLSHNDRALRTGGQLGPALFVQRSMTTYFADAMLKRRGVMVAAEYAHRTAPDPITRSGANTRAVFAGQGLNVQASWLTRRNWEPQLRFSSVTPARAIQGVSGIEATREGSVGLGRYVNGHRIKANGELFRTDYRNLALRTKRADWTLRLGAEVGI